MPTCSCAMAVALERVDSGRTRLKDVTSLVVTTHGESDATGGTRGVTCSTAALARLIALTEDPDRASVTVVVKA